MSVNNTEVFNSAFVGAFAGMVHNIPPSIVPADYTPYTNEANAFAIELDSLVPTIPSGPTEAQLDLFESLSYDYFAFLEAPAGSTTPADYAHAAAVVLAEYNSAITKPIPVAPVTPAFTPITQANWYVDPANATGLASDTNKGDTALNPLLTDDQRVRRMGSVPYWTLPRYDIYYLSDVPNVYLTGVRFGTCLEIWTHCTDATGTPFQGQSIVVPAAAITARAVIVEATNTRCSQTGGTANAHLSTGPSPNSRIRFVSGTVTGAVCFPQKTGGGAVCDVSQWTLISAWNPVTFTVPTEVTPAINDTYVIEKLGTIGAFTVDIISADGDSGTFTPINCDSINFGTINVVAGADAVTFLGCTNVNAASSTSAAVVNGLCNLMACQTNGGPVFATGFTLWMTHQTGTLFPINPSAVGFAQHCISQGCVAVNTVNGGSAVVFNLGVFDSNGEGVVAWLADIEYAGPFWGAGNTQAAHGSHAGRGVIDTLDGGTAAQLTCTGGHDFSLANKFVARAFNDTTGAYTEAGGPATRTTTWAHLAGTIAAGGFAGNAIDPTTGASFISI